MSAIVNRLQRLQDMARGATAAQERPVRTIPTLLPQILLSQTPAHYAVCIARGMMRRAVVSFTVTASCPAPHHGSCMGYVMC